MIKKIIDAATKAGAGIIGNYSQCAFIQKGQGNWKSEKGSTPYIGRVGKVSRVNEVKIEMECPIKSAKRVKDAIRKVHPYEEVVIEFLRLENI